MKRLLFLAMTMLAACGSGQQAANPVSAQTATVSAQTATVNAQTATVNAQANPVSAQATTMNSKAKTMDVEATKVTPVVEAALLETARQRILSGEAGCVLVKEGQFIDQERGGSVSPLLAMYDRRQGDFKGAQLVDKVIGVAAASIAVAGDISAIHGLLISEEAVAYLDRKGVAVSYDQIVPQILNRKRDGLCPMEATVKGIDDPKAAVQALRQKLDEFKKMNAQ